MENFILCAVEFLKVGIMTGKPYYCLLLAVKMPDFSENLKILITKFDFHDNLLCYGYMNHKSIRNL